MSKKMASAVIVYGVLLATFSFVIHRAAPARAGITLATGVAGGGLSVLWGLVALAGHKRRTWAVLTIVAVIFVILSQVVQAWIPATTMESLSLAVRLLVTLMLLMTVGMLMYLLHGERPPEFYSKAARQGSTPPLDTSS